MQFKNLLIIIFTLQFIRHGLNFPSSFIYLINGLFENPFELFYLINSLSLLIYLVIPVIGGIGLIQYFLQKNIFNKYLKIYTIHLVFVSITSAIQVILQLISPSFNSAYEFRIEFLIGLIISLIILFVILSVYQSEKIESKNDFIDNKKVRFTNFFIDGIYLSVFMLSNIGYLSLTTDGLSSFFAPEMLLAFISPFVYYTLSEAVFRQSIGKVVTDTYVLSVHGGRPELGKIIKRSLLRYIPFDSLSYLIDERNARWHDTYSDTDLFYKTAIDTVEEQDILDHLIIEE